MGRGKIAGRGIHVRIEKINIIVDHFQLRTF